jgi:hypothetical protein
MNSPTTGLRVASILFGIFAIAHGATDQSRPSHGRDPYCSDGRKLDRAYCGIHSLHLVLATLESTWNRVIAL